ncbi:hypothetical protein [Stenotrophomonas sp. TWI587]|uniref:hypothetical protein n=1 Tax=Stenotrophomonas sp. TWI587 TaxID=3136783 RepID=UPI003208CF63
MAKQKPQAPSASEAAVGEDQAAVASVAEVPNADGVAVATTPGGDSIGGPDDVAAQAATESVATGVAGALAVEESGQQQADDEQSPRAQTLPGAKVRALVLSDNAFGRCGEVREFDAAHSAAIEAGGFIDTHPNAVASAEGD